MQAKNKKRVGICLAVLLGIGGALWVWPPSSDENKNDLLVEAIYRGDEKTAAALLQNGANPNALGAVRGGIVRLEVLDNLCYRFPSLTPVVASFDRPHRESLLWLSAERSQPEIARLLLSHGAKVDITGNDGDTALMNAGHRGNAGLVKMLLAAGANVNYRSYAGMTPLSRTLDGPTYLPHYRGAGYHAETVRLLIAAGANVNTRTAGGETVLHYAQTNHRRDLAIILSKAGAK